MGAPHAVAVTRDAGLEQVELRSPDGLGVVHLPAAGMLCRSLRHHDAELLAPQGGLRAYREAGVLMGLPLMHP